MEFITRHLPLVSAIFLLTTALSGCAAFQEKPSEQAAAMPRDGAAGHMGMMTHGDSVKPMAAMDKKSMCDMHAKMKSGKTPQEQSAMMEAHMKNMSPEMRQKHMAMMEQQCQ